MHERAAGAGDVSSCDGRAVVVTGAGAGIGRAEALHFAREGARIVVNDVNAEAASAVADEIRALGGEAVANTDDVSDWDGAGHLVSQAIEAFGTLDTLVNNAGILRDKMFVNMTVEDWDAVMKVHLRGTFCPTKHAVNYWRDRSKAGDHVMARIVNTSSPSGIFGNLGQSNYGAAKAGIAGFTQILGEELWRYGVLVNAIAPSALTAMTEGLPGFADRGKEVEAQIGWNPGPPENLSGLVVWLGSRLATCNGRVFYVRGGNITVAEGWRMGPGAETIGPWEVDEVDKRMPALLEAAEPQRNAYGEPKGYGPGG